MHEQDANISKECRQEVYPVQNSVCNVVLYFCCEKTKKLFCKTAMVMMVVVLNLCSQAKYTSKVVLHKNFYRKKSIKTYI